MVENLRKVLNILKEDNKPVWFFASLKMDDLVDKWSLVLSAPWINDTNENDEYKNIFELVKSNITDEELSSIARLVLLTKEDHLIEELMKKTTNTEIKDEKVNGNMIHYGFIIESNPNLDWQPNKNLKLDIHNGN